MCRYIGVMYKIKNRITQRARLQIYHSFVQSHINYCSTVWGHASSTLIDSLFSQQKKGIRAVIPGFINYRYKDGETPGHTKPYFSEYKILNVHNLIALNSIITLVRGLGAHWGTRTRYSDHPLLPGTFLVTDTKVHTLAVF